MRDLVRAPACVRERERDEESEPRARYSLGRDLDELIDRRARRNGSDSGEERLTSDSHGALFSRRR